jgi:hypothetical protein
MTFSNIEDYRIEQQRLNYALFDKVLKKDEKKRNRTGRIEIVGSLCGKIKIRRQ